MNAMPPRDRHGRGGVRLEPEPGIGDDPAVLPGEAPGVAAAAATAVDAALPLRPDEDGGAQMSEAVEPAPRRVPREGAGKAGGQGRWEAALRGAAGMGAGAAVLPPALKGVEVTVSVEVGRHRLALAELMALEPAQVLELDRLASEPARVLVNGQAFATGEIVTVGDRFAVRLVALEERP